MQANKIILGDQVLIDLSVDTATPEKVLTGVTFHGADGAPAVGTMPPPPEIYLGEYEEVV